MLAQVSNHAVPPSAPFRSNGFLNKALEEDADIIATFAAISKVLQEATRQYCEEDGDRVHGHFEFDLGFLDPIKISDENPMDESGSDATTERLG